METMNENQPIVVSSGGGTNSLALLIGLKRRNVRPDLITFSDTKGEKPETYRNIEIASEWCVKSGFPPIVTVRTVSPTRGFEGLEGMVTRLGTLPSKAFGQKACSQRFKIEAQRKFLNQWPPAREAWQQNTKLIQVLGYDAGEPHRAKDFKSDKFEYWYPLIEWGWGRTECIQVIRSEGLPLPGKSACFFCPSMRKPEVIRLSREHPDLFNRAVDMERKALASGKLGVVKGLGRHWSWEELVKASEAQRELFPENRMGIDCACFDGEQDEDEEPE